MKTQIEFEKLFNNELSNEEARDFLVALHDRGEISSEIATAARLMREYSIKLPISQELQDKAIDIVGTGGDKSGTFNISTTVSLLLASMGCVVAKHGNRSVTSKSGSADALEALGIRLDLSLEQQAKMLEEMNFCFMFAPNHHPVMKHIMPIRQSIPHRTIFNILGPLANPAGVNKYLIGVFDESFIEPVANALVELKVKRAFVVSSLDGTDEISVSTKTAFAFVEDGYISHGEIDPEGLGFTLSKPEDILGGDAVHNATIIRDIFSGKESGAKLDAVLINAAFALFVDGKAIDIAEGIAMAKRAIENGVATKYLDELIEFSKKI
jgi:anthranilate phosphoribosyltransferase